MRCPRSLALAVLLTLGLGLAPMAQAAEPTEQLVRSTVDLSFADLVRVFLGR